MKLFLAQLECIVRGEDWIGFKLGKAKQSLHRHMVQLFKEFNSGELIKEEFVKAVQKQCVFLVENLRDLHKANYVYNDFHPSRSFISEDETQLIFTNLTHLTKRTGNISSVKRQSWD